MTHQLRQINIKGYKSIKNQEITLNELNVLIGQNGAGKSNFITIFRFLRQIIEQRLKNVSLKSGAESLLYYGSKETKQIEFYFDFSPNLYEVRLQPTNSNTLFISTEQCAFWDKNNPKPYWEIISTSSEESDLKNNIKSSGIANWVFYIIKEWHVYHFHDTSDTSGIKKFCSLADDKFLFEDASNLAAFLYRLKLTQETHYDRIVKTFQLVIPFFKDFILEPDIHDSNRIRLEWQDKYSDKTFTAHELSDGSLRFLCMVTLLLQKELPKMILLDEPELGLHPSAIIILAGLLKKASKKTQVIVSTQSVSLVNEFEPENILVVEHNDYETVFKRLNQENAAISMNGSSNWKI